MKYFVGLIFIFLTLSCETTDKENNSTYFGGEIINPKSNFVLFLKDNKIVDTLLLDKNNRFLKGYNSLKEGLYTFKHGLEFQYIYIEPTDSILIRLNTWDFDESLVFSGKGSNKNEFLINLFLQNEKEEKQMYQYFNLEESDFERKLDSLSNERTIIYENFSNNEEGLTYGFKNLTNTAIHFPLYRLKEIYPYFYKKAHKLDEFPSVSDNFYDYRKNINFNEENLVSFYSYQNYIVNYLYNLSYQLKEKDSTKNNITLNLLNLISENIELEGFKNTLFKGIVVKDFLNSESSCRLNNEVLDYFVENCNNPNYILEVEKLVNDSKIVVNNESLHDFELISYNNKLANISDIIKDKNTVIYFWSTEYTSSDYLLKRIKYLEKNNPNILFIGINIQKIAEDITTEPNLKLLDFSKQFLLTKDSYAHSFLTSNHPRSIIINKEGTVVNGFTYIGSNKFSSELNKIK